MNSMMLAQTRAQIKVSYSYRTTQGAIGRQECARKRQGLDKQNEYVLQFVCCKIYCLHRHWIGPWFIDLFPPCQNVTSIGFYGLLSAVALAHLLHFLFLRLFHRLSSTSASPFSNGKSWSTERMSSSAFSERGVIEHLNGVGWLWRRDLVIYWTEHIVRRTHTL